MTTLNFPKGPMPPRSLAVSVINPLMVPIGKPVLEAVLEDTLQAIHDNRAGRPESDDERIERDLLVQQREEFLGWVRAQPGPNISVALYPLEDNESDDTETGQDFRGMLLS